MTNPFAIDKTELDRHGPRESIAMELKQFLKHQHLADEEVAHRLAITVKEVRELRKMFGTHKIRLIQVPLSYQLRLTLGQAGIRTVCQLLAKTDAELLALPAFGERRLEQVRNTIKTFLEKVNG